MCAYHTISFYKKTNESAFGVSSNEIFFLENFVNCVTIRTCRAIYWKCAFNSYEGQHVEDLISTYQAI